MNAHAQMVDVANVVRLVDSYGRTRELVDDGGTHLEGVLYFDDGPMRYWIPRDVARSWRPA